MKNIEEILETFRLGVTMGSKLLWGVLSALAVLAWIYNLVASNPKWTIPSWLYLISLLIALSIGLTLYMGQRQRTIQMKNWGEGLAKDIQEARDQIGRLQKNQRDSDKEMDKLEQK